MAAIVYHAPFPLDREASSASGIRPVRMLDAFRELGYTVLDVTGSARERSRRLRAVAAPVDNVHDHPPHPGCWRAPVLPGPSSPSAWPQARRPQNS